MGGKAGDFVRKVAAEVTKKILDKYNFNPLADTEFICIINAERTKGKTKDGRIVNIYVSGHPNTCDFGLKVSENLYYMWGPVRPITTIASGKAPYIFLTNFAISDQDLNKFLRLGTSETLYRLPFDEITEDDETETTTAVVRRYTLVSQDGRHILLVKEQLFSSNPQILPAGFYVAPPPFGDNPQRTVYLDFSRILHTMLIKNFTLNSQTLEVSGTKVQNRIFLDASGLPEFEETIVPPVQVPPINVEFQFPTHRFNNQAMITSFIVDNTGSGQTFTLYAFMPPYSSNGAVLTSSVQVVGPPFLVYAYNEFEVRVTQPELQNVGLTQYGFLATINVNSGGSSYKSIDFRQVYSTLGLPLYDFSSGTTSTATADFSFDFAFKNFAILRITPGSLNTTFTTPYLVFINGSGGGLNIEDSDLIENDEDFVCTTERMYKVAPTDEADFLGREKTALQVLFINDTTCFLIETTTFQDIEYIYEYALNEQTNKFVKRSQTRVTKPITGLIFYSGINSEAKAFLR